MLEITDKVIEDVAKLSRLKINKKDMTAIKEKFSAVLKNFDQLKNVNTENVEPLIHFKEKIIPRSDKVSKTICRDQVLSSSKDHFEGCFRIQKVVDSGE